MKMTTEQALKAAKGAVLAETLAEQTGLGFGVTLVDLSRLELAGKAQETGGRYRYVAQAPTVKGGKVRKAGSARAKLAGKLVRHTTIYPIKIVTTRWKSRLSGQFVKTPDNSTPLKLSIHKPSTGKGDAQGLHVIRQHRIDPLSGERVPVRYSVKYPEARAAYKRGELGKAELNALERDIADGLLSAEGQKIMDRAERAREVHEMGAAFRSDKAKRGAVTRARKRASGIPPKRRNVDAIRTDWLKVQAKLEATRIAHLKARTPSSAANHKRKELILIQQSGKLRKEAQQAGLRL